MIDNQNKLSSLKNICKIQSRHEINRIPAHLESHSDVDC